VEKVDCSSEILPFLYLKNAFEEAAFGRSAHRVGVKYAIILSMADIILILILFTLY
jgi:hypothetical protein